MTFAPPTILDLAAFWEDMGGVSLGIVGNQRHCAGYHLGKDRIYGECACRPDGTCEPGLKGSDYSVKHPRDAAGLSNAASAIDLGRLNGSLAELRAFSRWLVAQCQSGRDAYRDIREVIYSPDGVTVQRYSGVDNGIHTGAGNGDTSHLSHTHISFFRDSEARDKRPMFAPYLIPDTGTGDDMAPLAITNQTLADVDLSVGDKLLNPDGTALVTVSVASTKRSPYGVTIGTTGYRVVPVSTGGKLVMALVPVAQVAIRPVTDASPYTEADLRARIDAAIAIDRGKARVTWEEVQ